MYTICWLHKQIPIGKGFHSSPNVMMHIDIMCILEAQLGDHQPMMVLCLLVVHYLQQNQQAVHLTNMKIRL